MRVAEIQDSKIVLADRENVKLDDKQGAIVKVLGCGLCGSDIVKYRDNLKPNGTVLGHEIVAEIVEINSSTSFNVGDKIVASHHIPCFKCAYCKGESYSMCEHFKSTNLVPGGFSEYVYLSEEHLLNVTHKIPKNLSNQEVAFYEPLGCCVRAIKRAKLVPQTSVMVIGLGSIGLIMGQALKSFGMRVFGCDLKQDRVDLANSLGITAFNSTDKAYTKEFVLSNTNNIGIDCIFMTSGANGAIDVALDTVRLGGKILVFSSIPSDLGYRNNDIYYKELTILGSYSPRPKDLKKSLELLTNGEVKVKDLATTYPVDRIQEAFTDTIENKVFKAYIEF